jgi:anti-anti-sigma factor
LTFLINRDGASLEARAGTGLPGWLSIRLAWRNVVQTTHLGSDRRLGAVHVVPETDEIVAVCLEGEFDMANTAALVEQLDHALSDNMHLVIDLSQTTFIDSTVINALFHASKVAKTRDRTVVLQLGTAPVVERLIEITDIERVICRATSRADAVQRIQQGSHRPSRSPRWGIPIR